MEQAVFLDQPDSIPAGNWSRFYYGSEFCSWTFPDTARTETAISAARDSACSFSLVTPVVSEPFIPRLRTILEQLLPQLQEDDEVVVSDLGTLRLLDEIGTDVNRVVGRALSGQKRGPRILDLTLKPAEIDYFKRGNWYQNEAISFLQEHKVSRVELDNLLQGIAPLPERLSGTLHLPWAMVTSSRNCPFREPGQTGPCPGSCGEVMTLTTPETSTPLFQAGNTQFLRNDTLPENLDELGIDRTVEHLVLPR